MKRLALPILSYGDAAIIQMFPEYCRLLPRQMGNDCSVLAFAVVDLGNPAQVEDLAAAAGGLGGEIGELQAAIAWLF